MQSVSLRDEAEGVARVNVKKRKGKVYYLTYGRWARRVVSLHTAPGGFLFVTDGREPAFRAMYVIICARQCTRLYVM